MRALVQVRARLLGRRHGRRAAARDDAVQQLEDGVAWHRMAEHGIASHRMAKHTGRYVLCDAMPGRRRTGRAARAGRATVARLPCAGGGHEDAMPVRGRRSRGRERCSLRQAARARRGGKGRARGMRTGEHLEDHAAERPHVRLAAAEHIIAQHGMAQHSTA